MPLRGLCALTTASLLQLGAITEAAAQSPGGAGDDDTSASSLDEIVVTSTRRAAAVQDLPMTVAVLSNKELGERDIMSVDQYALAVPSLNFNRPGFGDRQGLDITIRGVSNTRLVDGSAGAGAATTGFYIDEVAVTSVDPVLYDIARVEFLKGPQGTYFGQASMGGTIRVITNKPDPTRYSASVETKFANTQDGDPSTALRGVINMPIVENVLAVRFAGYGELEGGFIDWRPPSLAAGALRGSYTGYPPFASDVLERANASTVEKNANDSSAYGARLAVQYTPNDRLTILPVYTFQQRQSDQLPGIDRNLHRGFIQERFVATPQDEGFSQGSLTVEYAFPKATLTSVSGVFDRKLRLTQDATSLISAQWGKAPDGSIASTSSIDQEYRSDIFSQELRLTSRDDLNLGPAAVAWLFGAAYLDEGRDTDFLWLVPNHNQNVAPANRIPGADQGLYSAIVRNAGYESTAGFTDLTFKLFEKRLQISAGARWFEQKWDLAEVSSNRNNPAVPVLRPRTEGTERGMVPRASATFFVADHNTVYLSASKGFRAGGPGLTPSPPDEAQCLNAMRIAGITPGAGFESDQLWNYELGTKNTFANGRLQLNSAVFYIDWSDLQSSLVMRNFDPGCGRSVTTNAGDATIKGAEFEVAAAPTDELYFSASAAYVKARLGKPPVGVAVGKEGDPLQNSPEVTATVSGKYSFSRVFGGLYNGFLRADVTYTDELVSDQAFVSNPFYHVPSKTVANVRFGFAPLGGAWSTEIFVDNVTNEIIYYGAQPLNGESYTDTARVGRPRTYGLLIRKNW
jgi:outer membrane receptor protein involved in Fe transport